MNSLSVRMKAVLSVLCICLFMIPATSLSSGIKPATKRSKKYEYRLNNDGTAIFCGYGKDIMDNSFLSLRSFKVPEKIAGYKVTMIDDYAFSLWRNLKEVYLPGTIVSIGSYAFNQCGALSKVSLPDSLIEIGDNAFFYCNRLESIYIPSSVQWIDKTAFTACTDLTEVVVEKDSYAELYCILNALPYLDSEKFPNSIRRYRPLCRLNLPLGVPE